MRAEECRRRRAAGEGRVRAYCTRDTSGGSLSRCQERRATRLWRDREGGPDVLCPVRPVWLPTAPRVVASHRRRAALGSLRHLRYGSGRRPGPTAGGPDPRRRRATTASGERRGRGRSARVSGEGGRRGRAARASAGRPRAAGRRCDARDVEYMTGGRARIVVRRSGNSGRAAQLLCTTSGDRTGRRWLRTSPDTGLSTGVERRERVASQIALTITGCALAAASADGVPSWTAASPSSRQASAPVRAVQRESRGAVGHLSEPAQVERQW